MRAARSQRAAGHAYSASRRPRNPLTLASYAPSGQGDERTAVSAAVVHRGDLWPGARRFEGSSGTMQVRTPREWPAGRSCLGAARRAASGALYPAGIPLFSSRSRACNRKQRPKS